MSTYADAYVAFRKAEREAVLFDNSDWHRRAVHDERIKRLESARETLEKAMPAPAATDISAVQEKAADALRSLRPANADAVAVTSNEWAKVEARLNAGQNLAKLIEAADRETLSAVIDRMPTRLVSTSPEPEDAIAEIEALAVRRLAELGDETAASAIAAQRTASVASAWGAILEQASTRHSITADASALLYNADVDEWRATLAETPQDDHLIEQAIREVGANLDFGGSPFETASGGLDGTR
ncbi:hypothetical protein [Curtobacterium sp. NPDC089991]|uniref:hypothetical protein n=1 Tax=Curtobacterium sp. NPDC089991 TaxID=3363969 RepID=UPI0037F3111F